MLGPELPALISGDRCCNRGMVMLLGCFLGPRQAGLAGLWSDSSMISMTEILGGGAALPLDFVLPLDVMDLGGGRGAGVCSKNISNGRNPNTPKRTDHIIVRSFLVVYDK